MLSIKSFEWFTIETIPRERIRFIGAINDFVVGDIFFGTASYKFHKCGDLSYIEECNIKAFRYTHGEDRVPSYLQPTHWMPIPDAPSITSNKLDVDWLKSLGVWTSNKNGGYCDIPLSNNQNSDVLRINEQQNLNGLWPVDILWWEGTYLKLAKLGKNARTRGDVIKIFEALKY